MEKHYLKAMYLSIFLILLILPLTLSSAAVKNERYIVQVSDDKNLSSSIKPQIIEELRDSSKSPEKSMGLTKASTSSSISAKPKRLVIEGIDKKTLEKEKSITYIEPDYVVESFSNSDNWNFDVIGLNISNITGLGKNVKIALFDTGSNNNFILKGYDFVNEDNDTYDDNGHGTSISQLLKSENGGLPLTDAEIYSVKVLDKNGDGYVSDTIEGINWAIDNKINIVLMSFGGAEDSLFLKDAIDKAYSQGILFIAASGNDGKEITIYPAAYDSVSGVGSINKNFERSNFSNYGDYLEFVAPGENIKIGNSTLKGTSFSVPHVGIVAANLFSENPGINNQGIRSLLQKSTLDLGLVGRDPIFGYGLPMLALNNNNNNSTSINDSNQNSSNEEKESNALNIVGYNIKELKDFSKTYPRGPILSKQRTIYEKDGNEITIEIVKYNSSEFLIQNIQYSLSQGLEKKFDKENPYFSYNNTYAWAGKDYLVQLVGFNDNFSYENELIKQIIIEYPPELPDMNSSKNLFISSDFQTLSTCSSYGYSSCSNLFDEKRVDDIRYGCEAFGILGTSTLCWEPLSYNGDDDFCTNGAKCAYTQGDCDFNSQCESNFCAGPLDGIFGGANDGCCNSGEGYSKSNHACCVKGYTNEFMCNEGNVVRKYIGDNCVASWNVYQTCSNTQKCNNNACVAKTCTDFGKSYGSCTSGGQKKIENSNIFECKDQFPLDYFTDFYCWEKTASNGDGDYCDILDNLGIKCSRGESDCDINWDGTSECTLGLACDDDGQGIGDSIEGCCLQNENWDGQNLICNKAVYGKVFEVNQVNQSFTEKAYSNKKLLVFIEDTDLFSDDIMWYFTVDTNSNGEFDFNPERYISNWNWDTLFIDYKINSIFALDNNEIVGKWTNQYSNEDKYRSGRENVHQIVRIQTDKVLWKKNEIPKATNGEAKFKASSLEIKSLDSNTNEKIFLTWKGKIKINETGNYQFLFNITGNLKLIVDNETLIDTINHLNENKSLEIYFEKGEHDIYFEFDEKASNYPRIFLGYENSELKEITEDNLIKEDTHVDFINGKTTLKTLSNDNVIVAEGSQIVNNNDDYMVSFLDDTHAKSSTSPPIVLVHGLNGEAGYWDRDNIPKKLNDKGYNVWEFYYPANQRVDYSSTLLADSIDYVKTSSGKSKVNIIAHSMGGLVSRGYISNLGNSPNGKTINYRGDVDKMITLGSPFFGSYAANRIVFDSLFDLTEEIVKYIFGNDTSAPAYKDLSVGSQFTWNLNTANFSSNITVYSIGGTGDDIAPVRVFHKEDNQFSDSIVSLTSTNILQNGYTLITFPLNHANLKGDRIPPQGWFTSYNTDREITVMDNILSGASESTINNNLDKNNGEFYIKPNSVYSDNNTFSRGSIIIKITNPNEYISNLKIKNQKDSFTLIKNENTGIWFHFDGGLTGTGLSVPIGNYSLFSNDVDTNRDIEIKPTQTSLYNINLCNPNWAINETWSLCDITDHQYKNYFDTKACGWGDPPERLNQTCDFCKPNWTEVKNSCLKDDSIIGWFNDTNSCFDKTHLVNDTLEKPNNNTYSLSCDYNKDGFIGNKTLVNTTIPLDIIKENNTIKFNENNNPFIEFDFNLTETPLNLANLFIEKQSNQSTFAYVLIKGLDLSIQNKTKIVYLDKILNGTGICIKDEEFSLVSKISSDCNQANEVWLPCSGTSENYACEILNNTQYKISGLRHSGVKEQATYCGDAICNGGETCSSCSNDCGTCPTPPPSGGGGGGGGGGSSITPKKTNMTSNKTNVIQTNTTNIPIVNNTNIAQPNNTTTSNKTQSGLAGITGAVIGIGNGKGIAIISIFLIVILVVGFILIMHRRNKNKSPNKYVVIKPIKFP